MSDEAELVIPGHIRRSSDGRLLLVGGNHAVERMFSIESPPVSDDQVSIFLSNHFRRTEWTNQRGISFSQWIFPDPILFEGAMPGGTVRSVFESSVLPEKRHSQIHYPLSLLDKFPERQSLTDSHYSWIGGMYIAADVIAKTLGLDISHEIESLYTRRSTPVLFTGDLGAQCTPHISEQRARQPGFEGIVSASNGVQAGNMGILQLVFSPNSKTERTLLIFGDSFFRALLPELSRYWRKIIFCRTQFFHDEMVSAVSPDDILCGLAERYFASTLSDDERPHFLAYLLISGRATSPDPDFSLLWASMIDAKALAGH